MKPYRCLVVLGCSLLAGTMASVGPAAPPDLEAKVKALVRQLGDEEFARREAAQEALRKLGPDIVPILDRLGPPLDAEVRSRLDRLHRDLVGYLEDIRAGLAALPAIKDEERPALPDGLEQVIRRHQPQSGDFLLSLVAEPQEKLHRPAIVAFVHTWDSMSADQIHAYLRQTLLLKAQHRACYPQGIDAAVRMFHHPRYGYGSWPPGDTFRFTTHTSHFLDGKPYGRSYTSYQPIATTGWIWTKDLSLGKHTCALDVEYEFLHRGGKYTGRLRSPDFSFTMVAADTPDDLIAPANQDTDRMVHDFLLFADRELDVNQPGCLVGLPPRQPPERRPQITWDGPGGKRCGLAPIFWRVAMPLPADLCFEVTLQDQKTGKVYPCEPLVLRRWTARWGYFGPLDAVEFARGRTGDVPVKVVLKPSRKTALTSTEITGYYSGSITSEVHAMKVFDNYVEPDSSNRK
jgi:hypothetical protein